MAPVAPAPVFVHEGHGLTEGISGAVGSPAWSNALLAGIIYGFVHVIGPDHLGTLMTLSVAASRQNAFKVGAAWGLGHSFGMVLIGALFVIFHGLIRFNIDAWEHVGDYVIGASMVLCAAYFIFRESDFLEKQSDGSYVQRPCACHGGQHSHVTATVKKADLLPPEVSPVPSPVPGARMPRGRTPGHKFCHSFRGCRDISCSDSSCASECSQCEDCSEQDFDEDEEEPEMAALLPKGNSASSGSGDCSNQAWSDQHMKGGILGVLQGVCCPMGMVGISFLAKMHTSEVVAFLITFMLVSAFGTALLAWGWASLASHGIGVSISPRTVYRASCGFTLGLGVTWIVANYTGFLDKLDYTAVLHHGH